MLARIILGCVCGMKGVREVVYGGKATSYHFRVWSEAERASYLGVCSPLAPPVVHQPPHLPIVDTTPLYHPCDPDDVAGSTNAHIPQGGEGQREVLLGGDLVMWQEYNDAARSR